MRERGKVPHFLATDSEFVQHQLMDCVAVTRVTVHLDTVAISACIGLWYYFHQETRETAATVI